MGEVTRVGTDLLKALAENKGTQFVAAKIQDRLADVPVVGALTEMAAAVQRHHDALRSASAALHQASGGKVDLHQAATEKAAALFNRVHATVREKMTSVGGAIETHVGAMLAMDGQEKGAAGKAVEAVRKLPGIKQVAELLGGAKETENPQAQPTGAQFSVPSPGGRSA